MRIGIDAMGGDFAPEECIKGVLAESDNKESQDSFVIYGEEEALNPWLDQLKSAGISVVFCGDSIGMSEHATKAVASKKDASINIGIYELAQGKIDAFAGAGNTGAMMVSSIFNCKTINQIERPALTTVVPQRSGQTGVLLDVGANSDVKPENLMRFGILGSVYAKAVYGIPEPRVALMSIGEEKEKGNILTQSAYPLLEENEQIRFIGNIEGRHLFNDMADVVVCDGFTGNIVVKTCEGFFYNLLKRGVQDDFLNRFNFELYGGSAILGIRKPVIVGHGISKKITFQNMIKLAKNVVASNLISKIESSFA
jgi:glycerol-3-phosphate acyltransferase PlsX